MESYVGSISNRNIFVQSSNNILSNHTSGYGSLVYPTFYIKPNITLSGAGLKSDTYVIYEYVDSENDSTSTPDTNTPSQVVEVPSTSCICFTYNWCSWNSIGCFGNRSNLFYI